MGIINLFQKGASKGMKAYRLHVTGMQLRKQGKLEEAQAKLDEAFVLYGQGYEAGFRKPSQLLAYAILTMQRGDYERARELMLEGSKDKTMSKEDRFTLRVNYSICQWKQGKLDKAIETIRQAAGDTKNSLIYTTLGMYLVDKAKETGEFEEAKAYLDEAMEYDDEDSATLDNLGFLYLAMAEKAQEDGDAGKSGEYREKAYEYYKKAHEEKEDQITSTYYLAKLEHERGNDQAARELVNCVNKLPFTAICPIQKCDFEKLSKEIG